MNYNLLYNHEYGSHLSQEPAFEVVEAETVVPTICDQHIPHAAMEN